MKLAAHYNKASIIISVVVLLISGFVYYLIISHIARNQLDDGLREEIAEVVSYVNLNENLPKLNEFDGDQTSFVKTKLTKYDTRFFDASYLNTSEKKTEDGRAVSALIRVKNENYIATVVISRENTQYLLQIISLITLILTIILISVLAIANKYLLNGLWRPFYHILYKVKAFNIGNVDAMNPIETRVDEFEELNEALSTMASRVTKDYQGLKMFTENASHEMMTPIAVVTSKLDMLIQDDELKANQFAQITDIYSAITKLSRLNQSLLLLMKIDNDLIKEKEQLNIKTIILEKAQQFHEMIMEKQIKLDYQLIDIKVNASRYLMDILINNLFSNAIRHNKPLGSILIRTDGNTLVFQNSGEPVALDQHEVFERFYKGAGSDGTGLGLAIIKNICTQYKFDLNYKYADSMHTFVIKF